MSMKNSRIRITTLAALCMFDIDGTAARRYMENVVYAARSKGVRDVSPAGAFAAAGKALYAGITGVEKKYPELSSNMGPV